MEAASVYIKTQDGREELSSRAHRLSARERATLIMIDGHRCLAELQRLSPAPGEVTRHLQAFLETGLVIRLVMPPTMPQTHRKTAGMSASKPQANNAALENTRRYLLDVAHDTLGNEAAAFAAQVVQAETARKLLDLAHHLRDAVHRYSNVHEAEQFWETVREIIPKA